MEAHEINMKYNLWVSLSWAASVAEAKLGSFVEEIHGSEQRQSPAS